MKEIELIKLGFEKDKLLGYETGKWKMPWGGAIYINDTDDVKSLVLKAFEIGVSKGVSDGERIGELKFQNKLRTLIGL